MDAIGHPTTASEIRKTLVAHGATAAKTWNLSQILKDAGSRVARTNRGWELTQLGRDFISPPNRLPGSRTELNPGGPIAKKLRLHAEKVSNTLARDFILEAVSAFEYGLHRSAVVLAWCGAVAILHQHVFDNHLSAFNLAATVRNQKWKNAKSIDDLTNCKESALLEILVDIGAIDRNTKKELINCLDRRNSCGHPNSLRISDATVASHIEILILNVFSKC